MKPKRVKWTEFNALGFQMAKEQYLDAKHEDFEKTYEGEIISTYSPLIGSPRFVVALPDGEIREVKMTTCRVTEFEGKK